MASVMDGWWERQEEEHCNNATKQRTQSQGKAHQQEKRKRATTINIQSSKRSTL